ncbi:MAG TPA: SDR family NAD(P)-dependent oxidoreductase [Jiangellaceae bacterium]|nr:SDR family NAD(P)-dependent oxidoreductase [Jiangellaceae bacterium]
MGHTLRGARVLITGASSGIGRACAEAFAAAGASVVLAARRLDRLQRVAAGLDASVHLLELDVRDRAAVEQAIASLPGEWAQIDVLVNNAGLAAGLEPLQDGDPDDWDRMVDTNVKGLLYVTRAVVPGMVARGRGHVINIGSIAGHETYPNGAVYCATKAAVDRITTGLRLDVLGTGVKVSTVDPGMVETEFSVVRFHNDRQRASEVYAGVQPLSAEDIAETVVWVASRPPHVQVTEVIVLASAQASATRVHREPA